MRNRSIAIIVLAGLAGIASADQPKPPTKPTLTLAAARKVLAAAEKSADEKQAGGAIAVVDDGGHVVALIRRDDTFPAAARVAAGKARTAAIFRKATRDFEKTVNDGRTAMVAMDDFTPLQGGVPLVINGAVVGAVGVSGAHSAAEDDEIAIAAAAAIATPIPMKKK